MENSVSQWPKKEGRFAQVSGLRFEFDGSLPAGARVAHDSVMFVPHSESGVVGARVPIELARGYSVCTIDFIAAGAQAPSCASPLLCTPPPVHLPPVHPPSCAPPLLCTPPSCGW